MIYRIEYSAPNDITSPDFLGKKLSFPVSFVLEKYVDAADESAHTASINLVVAVSDLVMEIWEFNEKEWGLVLFEFGRRHLKKTLEDSVEFEGPILEVPKIVTYEYPDGCPFDPKMIPEPNRVEKIEVARRIGFHA